MLSRLKKIVKDVVLHIHNQREYKSSRKKVIIGCGTTRYRGWISTDQWCFDVLDEKSMNMFLKNEKAHSFLAEHVFEHLTPEQCQQAFENIRKNLVLGGNLRIAVPDGYHPDPSYISMVRPGGSGAGAWDHKQLWNYQTLSEMLEQASFSTNLLEYFDENGHFHIQKYCQAEGHIKRSLINDLRNKKEMFSYTSLIVDAKAI